MFRTPLNIYNGALCEKCLRLFTYHIHDITTCKYIWQGPKRASEKALLTEHETFTPDVIANLIFELYKFLTKLNVLLKVPFVSVK